jgi:transposase
LITEKGLGVERVSRDLDLHPNMVHRWKKHYMEDQMNAFPGKGHLTPQDEEIRRLKRELADMKEERDILKKAVGIFSKHRG